MDDFDFKMKIISLVMLFVCIGVIIVCLLDPTQSSSKTFCLCSSLIGVMQWLVVLLLLK